MKMAVNLVTWNGSKYIPYLFRSLKRQTYQDWKLYILDNGSTDDTVALVKKELNTFVVQSELIENKDNTGFAAGHNELLRHSAADYVCLVNQDLCLDQKCLEFLLRAIEHQPKTAAVAPLLLRWQFPDEFGRTIDALGLKSGRSRRVVEWLAGEKWARETAKPLIIKDAARLNCLAGIMGIEVFGVSGSLGLFLRSALDRVALSEGKVFDESYGSYKEDVDLAYRLRSAGYNSFVLLDTFAYHDRSAPPGIDRSDRAAAKNKIQQPSAVRYDSYKNHLLTLYKNEYWQNFLFDWPWILWYEGKKFIWFLLFDRRVLRGWGEVWRMRKELKVKRLKIKELRRAGWRELRRWWT